MKSFPLDKWGLEWFSKNLVNGVQTHLIYEDYYPKLFRSRKEAREYSENKYGYIKTRKDLRIEPHGWRMPRPVKIISIEYETCLKKKKEGKK